MLLAGLTIAIGTLFYREALISVAQAVLNRDDSSHGVFVPFLSAFFLWIKRDTLVKTELKTSLLGFPIMIAGFIPYLLKWHTFQLQAIGFIIFLSGAVLLILGKNFFKDIAFPIYFLITLIPLPDDLYLHLAETIRVVSFGGSRFILSVLGVPFFRDGNYISLHNTTLLVAISCSGIRYLVSYFVFSFAYAYLFKTALWSRVAVVISSIFISLVASIGRLSAIFILANYISPKMAEHKPHIIISWCIFFIVLFMAVGIDQHFQKKIEKVRQD